MKSPGREKGYQILILITILLLAIISAVQAKPYERYDPATGSIREMTFANIREGRRLFQNFCIECHGGRNGGAGFIDPGSRARTTWNTIFHEAKVPCANAGHWSGLVRDHLPKINDYLYHDAPDERQALLGWRLSRYCW